MEGNEGPFDRIVRGIAGAILLTIGGSSFTGPIALVEGVFALIMAIAGGGLLLTGLVGWCPAYALLGIRTCAPKQAPR